MKPDYHKIDKMYLIFLQPHSINGGFCILTIFCRIFHQSRINYILKEVCYLMKIILHQWIHSKTGTFGQIYIIIMLLEVAGVQTSCGKNPMYACFHKSSGVLKDHLRSLFNCIKVKKNELQIMWRLDAWVGSNLEINLLILDALLSVPQKFCSWNRKLKLTLLWLSLDLLQQALGFLSNRKHQIITYTVS